MWDRSVVLKSFGWNNISITVDLEHSGVDHLGDHVMGTLVALSSLSLRFEDLLKLPDLL